MKKFILALFIALAALMVFVPSFQGDFLSWDDELNIQANPFIQGNDTAPLWEKPYVGMYIPLTYTIWNQIYQVSHSNPIAFKVFNLALHIANALLVFILLLKFFGEENTEWCFFGALLFALHPMQADAVSWISGGRDLLASFFALLTVLAFTSSRREYKWIAAPLFFALGLLCKPSIAALPIILFFLELSKKDWRRWKINSWIKSLMPFIPWLLLVIPVIYITSISQNDFIVSPVSWYLRPIAMLDSYGFYIQKFLWPAHLMTVYERLPNQIIPQFYPLLATIPFSLALIFLMIWKKTRETWLLPGICFLILLLPISGIVSFSFQNKSSVANHYFYLGIIPLIVGLISQLKFFNFRNNAIFKRSVFTLICFASFLSIQRSKTWTSEKTFAEALLQENPDSYTGHIDISKYYLDHGNPLLSYEHAYRAYELKPTFRTVINVYIAYYNLGKYTKVTELDSDLDTAIFKENERLQPLLASSLFLIVGRSWAQIGNLEKALERICQAIQYNPTNKDANQKLEKIIFLLKQKKINLSCPN